MVRLMKIQCSASYKCYGDKGLYSERDVVEIFGNSVRLA